MPVFSADGPERSDSPRPDWVRPFDPLPGNGDLHTIAARYWPASVDESRFPTEARWFDTEPGVRVSAKLNRSGGEVTLLVIHGLTACTDARYMLSLAQQALEAGFDVLRVNVRNCGGTEAHCPTLYHSGLTADWRHVVEQLAPNPLILVGFSMGGNQALKLAGEWGDEPPAHVLGVCGISVPIRLDICARKIGEFRNRVYEIRFLRQLGATLRLKQQLMPERFASLTSRHPSIWEFDDKVTAPAFGFDSAQDYYTQASAAHYLDRIRVPALLIEAVDDPFIPFDTAYANDAFHQNPQVNLLKVSRGGHVGFLSRNGSRFWAETQAVRWAQTLAR